MPRENDEKFACVYSASNSMAKPAGRRSSICGPTMYRLVCDSNVVIAFEPPSNTSLSGSPTFRPTPIGCDNAAAAETSSSRNVLVMAVILLKHGKPAFIGLLADVLVTRGNVNQHVRDRREAQQ